VDVERAREIIATERPRRLRLGEILYDLGARKPADAADGPDGPDGTGGAASAAVLAGSADDAAALAAGAGFATALVDGAGSPTLAHVVQRRESLTVGELVDRASEGGFGFLIGILALIAIPFFGLSTPFGFLIALIGTQLMIGRPRPWLPERARRRALSMSMLDRVAALFERRARFLTRSTRRRWETIIMPRAIGFGVVLLALGLALPLPIPGSNLVFLVPLLIYAIGLLERDGAWIAVAHAWLVVNLVLMLVFAGAVWVAIQHLGRWLF
jgi:hypothetical protein